MAQRARRRFIVEPVGADRNGVPLTGRALAAVLSAATYSTGRIVFASRARADAAAAELSERSPDGLRVVWRVQELQLHDT
jgi:hypothetical protein